LLALTDFSPDNVAYVGLNDYHFAILSVLNHIESFSQGKVVAMPIIGSGLARLNREKQTILNYFLSIMKMSENKLTNQICIVINKADRWKVSLQQAAK
jgi:hypothetical protein